MLYGLDCCQLSKTDLCSLDFTFNRLFRELFGTNGILKLSKNVKCHCYFASYMPSCLIKRKADKFLLRMMWLCRENGLCKYCCFV